MGSLIDKIIRDSDIIIEVVDSRAVDYTRNENIEKKIIRRGKYLIIVSMKSDLVDEEKLKEKLKSLPYPSAYASYRNKKGYKDIRRLLKILAHKVKKEKNKQKVVVGVIGYTNVGKSSLINLITFSSKAKKSPIPGYTKKYQWIRLREDILLIDSAGVISAKSTRELDVFKGNLNPEKVECLGEALKLISFAKKYGSNLDKVLRVNLDGSEEEVLKSYALKRKFLTQNNEVDLERAAKDIIRKWNKGEIAMFIP